MSDNKKVGHRHLWVLAKDIDGTLGASCFYGTCEERLSVARIETILSAPETQAAPDLLEALKSVAYGDIGGESYEKLEYFRNIAKAAIQKATPLEDENK